MSLEINAQFNQFVQFAQDRPKPKTSKAIARAGDEFVGNGNLAGRSIVRAGNDRVAPLWWRSQGKKAANDAGRNTSA